MIRETRKRRLLFDYAINYLKRNNIEFAQNQEEFWWLWNHLLNLKADTILEIGSREGGSLFVLAHALPKGAKIISVDLPGGCWGWSKSIRSLRQVLSKLRKLGWDVQLIGGNSHSEFTKNRLLKILNSRLLDFIFVDGDHHYDGVKKDWLQYSPLVKSEGLVAFHDLVSPNPNSGVEVYRLWRELNKDYPCKSCIVEWGIGIVYV